MSEDPAVTFVVAMDRDRLIGRDGALPWRLPRDLKHFRSLTWGKPIIMGRKTYESIGRPLPGRRNIVLSRSGLAVPPEVLVADSVDRALELARRDGADEAMIVGGGQVYDAFLDRCRTIHLTLIEGRYEGDTRLAFDPLASSAWRPVREERWRADSGDHPDATYFLLHRVSPPSL